MKKKDESLNCLETGAQSEAEDGLYPTILRYYPHFSLQNTYFFLAMFPKTELPQYNPKEFWSFFLLRKAKKFSIRIES